MSEATRRWASEAGLSFRCVVGNITDNERKSPDDPGRCRDHLAHRGDALLAVGDMGHRDGRAGGTVAVSAEIAWGVGGAALRLFYVKNNQASSE